MIRYLLILLALAGPGIAAAADAPWVLTHATVIDGTGAPPSADTTVVIRDGRLADVYPSGSKPLPEGARVEDLRGRFVIPGLIDAHVHLTGAAPDAPGYGPLLHALLRGGVTTVRDMAGDDRLLQYLAWRANAGAMPSPDIYYVALLSGPSFFAEDGRAQAASAGEPLGFAPWMQAITATTDIPLAIAEARGTGASGVKLYANLPAALVQALSAEAHRQGLHVWTHATIFPATPMDAVKAGADTLSHSAYLVWQAAPRVPDDYGVRAQGDFTHVRPDAPAIVALLDAMHERGTILDATLYPFERQVAAGKPGMAAGMMPWSYAVTRLAREHGVLVDAGSDSAGLPSGADGPDLAALPAVHAEMALLVAHCGFTPLQAIHAATEVSAMAAGRDADRGTITAGKRADLVVLDADPLQDIHNTGRIAFVVKDGKRVQ